MELRRAYSLVAKPICAAALVGFGLVVAYHLFVVVFHLFVVDPPVIDSRGVAETLVLGGEADARSPEPIRSPSQVWQSSGVEALAFSSDGKYLATGGHDGIIGIWSAGDWIRAGEIKQEGWVAEVGVLSRWSVVVRRRRRWSPWCPSLPLPMANRQARQGVRRAQRGPSTAWPSRPTGEPW